MPGVRSVPLPGHTPGHTGYMVTSGGESLFIWADVVHLPGIQFAEPKAGLSFDTNSAQAVASRAARPGHGGSRSAADLRDAS